MNLLAGLQKAGAVLAILQGLPPLLASLVGQAEALFPNAKSGATKLAWVQTTVKDFLTFAGVAVSDVEAVIPAITLMINNLVAAAKSSVPPAVTNG
jgi:hypothetical protein